MKGVRFLRNSLTGKFALALLILIAGAFAMTTIYPVTPSQATPKMTGVRPESFTELAEKHSSAVVNIRAERDSKGMHNLYQRYLEKNPLDKNNPFHDFFEKFFGGPPSQNFKQRSLGSGFIIDEDGFIVTNNHVIKGADKIKVILKDGREFDAEIKGRDPNTDLALIKIDPDKDLPAINMGDSDKIKVGEWVVAIGNPFGLGHTVTAGIISAKGRVIGAGPYDDFLQTDASINPGNSGGPLIDLHGNVVGINTAIIAGGQGIGFAIPVNLAKGVIEQLKTRGEVTRGWLGVAIQDMDKELKEYYGLDDRINGVLVTQVFKDDPADKAGIQPNDIILEVNGEKVENSRELSRLIADSSVGEAVKILLWRDGEKKALTVKLGKRENLETAAAPGEPAQKELFGIKVADLTPEIAQQFGLKDEQGVVVMGVESGSKGEDAGIQPGDVIKEINHQPIKNVKDFKKEVGKVASGKPVFAYLFRPQKGFVVIKLTK